MNAYVLVPRHVEQGQGVWAEAPTQLCRNLVDADRDGRYARLLPLAYVLAGLLAHRVFEDVAQDQITQHELGQGGWSDGGLALLGKFHVRLPK